MLAADQQQTDADSINVHVWSSEGLTGFLKAGLVTNGNYDGLVNIEDWRSLSNCNQLKVTLM